MACAVTTSRPPPRTRPNIQIASPAQTTITASGQKRTRRRGLLRRDGESGRRVSSIGRREDGRPGRGGNGGTGGRVTPVAGEFAGGERSALIDRVSARIESEGVQVE